MITELTPYWMCVVLHEWNSHIKLLKTIYICRYIGSDVSSPSYKISSTI